MMESDIAILAMWNYGSRRESAGIAYVVWEGEDFWIKWQISFNVHFVWWFADDYHQRVRNSDIDLVPMPSHYRD